MKNNDISDFERFITVFINSDIKGKRHFKYIEQFIKKVKNPLIRDMCLLKLVSYYFLRSKSRESDIKYQNLIANLIVTAQGKAKNKKSKIIADYQIRKNISRITKQKED